MSGVFRVTVHHDGGEADLLLVAQDQTHAALLVCRMEGCPLRSIRGVVFVEGVDDGAVFHPVVSV